MWGTFGSLAVPWILFAQMSRDMSYVPVITATPPSKVVAEVRDRGGVFSRDAERWARGALQQIRREHRIPILIETIDSLDGEAIDDAARRRARWIGAGGIYILVAGRERGAAVVVTRRGANGHTSDRGQAAIREAFLGPLREGDFDVGLERGVRAIRAALADSAEPATKSEDRYALILVATVLGFLGALLAVRLRRKGLLGGARNEAPNCSGNFERKSLQGGIATMGTARSFLWLVVLASGSLLGIETSPAQAQGIAAPAPSYAVPAPRYTYPAPAYVVPAPRHTYPASAYVAPAYATPAPHYAAPAPAYTAPAPVYAAPASASDYDFYRQALHGG
jgi:uncharacterized membrane protein YgcG